MGRRHMFKALGMRRSDRSAGYPDFTISRHKSLCLSFFFFLLADLNSFNRCIRSWIEQDRSDKSTEISVRSPKGGIAAHNRRRRTGCS